MDTFLTRVMPYLKPDLSGFSGPALSLGHNDAPVVRDLGNGLLVLYVIDAGQSFEVVQNRHLSGAGVDADALHGRAMGNFRAFMAGRARVQPYGSAFALFLDRNFEASLLLADELWDGPLAGYAPNGFVVAVPARDVLAFADAASASGVEELRGIVSRVSAGGDHLIASELYRRQAGRWLRLVGEAGAAPDRAGR